VTSNGPVSSVFHGKDEESGMEDWWNVD